MNYINNFFSFENISLLCTKFIYKLVESSDHVINMNKNRKLLSVDSYSSVSPEIVDLNTVLKKYTWIARKFNHPKMEQYNLFHHAFVIDKIGEDIILIEYSGETDYKNKASIKQVSFNDFIKNSIGGQFFVHNIDVDHMNDEITISTLLEKRLGETKYNFINNNCENLCIDILIKEKFKNNYYTQSEYLFDLPGYGLFFLPYLETWANKFYEKKNNQDRKNLKKYIPSQYVPNEKKVLIYNNIL